LQRTKSIGVLAAVWIVAFAAPPPSWAGPQSPGGLRSAGQGVTLVAQLPDTAGMAWFISPVAQAMLEDGQTAEMVILQQSWTFARGETLDAQCQVTTEPQATAQLFTSKPQDLVTSFVSPASLLGTSQVRTFPLVANFDPANGSQTDAQILLIVHGGPGDASSASVRITVIAL
jgi:hypothetical protein